MINYIWGLFLLIGIVYSFFTNNTLNINQELLTSGSSAIDMIIKLIPLMCLWLGVMNIAIHSGLLDKMAKKISKVVNIIFPEIQDNEAISLISSNIIMNMLGLGNAATPFGLKAMKRMQELNDKKESDLRVVTWGSFIMRINETGYVPAQYFDII